MDRCGGDFIETSHLIFLEKIELSREAGTSPKFMEATITCQECARPISSDSARSCIQCSKAFCQSCVDQGPGYLGATCSLECLERFEDSISKTTLSGQVFITGKASSNESRHLGLRIRLDRQTFQEPCCADQLRQTFAVECDPKVSSFFWGGHQYPCFDSFFQAGKVLENTHTQQWFITQYPLFPGQNRLTSSWQLCNGRCRSRVYYCSCPRRSLDKAYTEVLVPTYLQLLRKASVMKLLRNQLSRNRDIILYDPSYIPSKAGIFDIVTSEAVEAARSCYQDPVPYGLLVAGELLGIDKS